MEEGGGEKGGFGAACAGVNFQQAGEGCERVRWDERSFQSGYEGWEGGGGGFDFLRGERFDLVVTGWVGEEGIELFDRLQDDPSVQPCCIGRRQGNHILGIIPFYQRGCHGG